jgi:plasmid stabilization system protein ParE
MGGAARVIDWNGTDVPAGVGELLAELPPGRYRLEAVRDDEGDRVELAPKAVADFDELLAYPVERNPTAAVKLRVAVLDDFARLARTSPRLDGPAVTLATGERCRRSVVHPVAIYYRRAPGVLEVMRAYHHAREPIAR